MISFSIFIYFDTVFLYQASRFFNRFSELFIDFIDDDDDDGDENDDDNDVSNHGMRCLQYIPLARL